MSTTSASPARATAAPSEATASVSARRPDFALVVLAYILICLIWGTTWIGIKVAVDHVPPVTSAGIRFLIAAPLLVLLVQSRRDMPLQYPRESRWLFGFVALGYFCVPYLLLNIGEQHISSGLTAILFASVSVLIVAFSVPILRTRLTPRQVTGILTAFVSLALLVLHREGGLSYDNRLGAGAVLLAAVMHSFAYVIIKKHGGGLHVFTLNTLPITTAGVLLTGAGLAIEQPGLEAFTFEAIVALIYLGIVASVIGFLDYFWLLQRLNTVTVSFVFVLFPIIAQGISAIVEHEPLSGVDVLLVGVVLSAFAITQRSSTTKQTRRNGQQPGSETPAAAGPGEPGASDNSYPRPLSESVLDRIYEHARSAYPEECCGVIFDSGVREAHNAIDELRDAAPQEFTRSTHTGFALSFDDLLTLERSLDGPDPARIVYHSHPDCGAYFSEEDQRHAVREGQPVHPVQHLVVDVAEGQVRGSRLFHFDTETAAYVEAIAFGSPKGNGRS